MGLRKRKTIGKKKGKRATWGEGEEKQIRNTFGILRGRVLTWEKINAPEKMSGKRRGGRWTFWTPPSTKSLMSHQNWGTLLPQKNQCWVPKNINIGFRGKKKILNK